MRLGFVGLGKMGRNMVLRLLEKGHAVTAHDADPEAVRSLKRKKGVTGAEDLASLTGALKGPRTVWIMVPHAHVGDVLKDLEPHLKKGDTVIDGGNSPYQDSKRRAARLAKKGAHFLDAGVSGGPEGARKGSCIMVGGDPSAFRKHERLFRDLAVKGGYAHVGKSGAGHFVKMVHNGIEYGMMQAMAEGFHIMHKTREFDLDMAQAAELYRHGSVISSNLMDWMAEGYRAHGGSLKAASGKASESGEGRWTVETAKKLGVRADVIEGALKARARSQKNPNYQGRVVQTLRNQFGGHPLKDR